MIESDAKSALSELNVSRETLDRLESFIALLKDWRQKINLVGPREMDQIWARHVLDSAQLIPMVGQGASIIDLGSGAGFPGLVLGCHAKTTGGSVTLVESVGKTPIYVRKDVNGFVVNSVLWPFMVEPAWMVSAGETTIREADAALVHRRGYPMGPFELGDLTGIDIGYSVREEAGIENPPLIEEKVEAEELGQWSMLPVAFATSRDGEIHVADYQSGMIYGLRSLE